MDASKDGESSEPVSTPQVIKFWRSVIKTHRHYFRTRMWIARTM